MLLWSKNLQKNDSEANMRIERSSLRSNLRSPVLRWLGYQSNTDQNRPPTAVDLTTLENPMFEKGVIGEVN